MKMVYERNLKTRQVTDKELEYIYNFYPLKEAVFIPFIKDEFRVDETMEDAGAFNDALICDIINSVEVDFYIGTTRHVENYFSDYYESDRDFVNVLFSIENDICYVEAIFYSGKDALKS